MDGRLWTALVALCGEGEAGEDGAFQLLDARVDEVHSVAFLTSF